MGRAGRSKGRDERAPPSGQSWGSALGALDRLRLMGRLVVVIVVVIVVMTVVMMVRVKGRG